MVPVGGLSRRFAHAVRVHLVEVGSSVPRLVATMPRDSFGRNYSYRAVTRKLAGDARLTLDDIEAICAGLGIEPHVLLEQAARYLDAPDDVAA